MTSKIVLVFLLESVLLVSTACEIPTSVTLKDGPSFTLSGSGHLASFTVYGPEPGHKIATPLNTGSVVWQIRATDGYFKGAMVEHMKVRYGSLPQGYLQTVPNDSPLLGCVSSDRWCRSPRVLEAGEIYYFFAETTDAPGAEGFFYMDGSAPIELKIPGLCQSGFSGNLKAINCETGTPYVEPQNLDKFVREQRVKKWF